MMASHAGRRLVSHLRRARTLLSPLFRHGLTSMGFCSCGPSFLLVGAQKAGTTSMFHYLAEHPNIRAAPEKEIGFFDQDVNYRRGVAWYHSRFPLAIKPGAALATFEATPQYLYYPWAAQRIRAYAPGMKIIVVLRNPVERAYSAWNMFRQRARNGFRLRAGRFDPSLRKIMNGLLGAPEFPSFEACVEREIEAIGRGGRLPLEPSFVRRGFYAEQLQRYFQYFPRDQVCVVESGALKSDPAGVLAGTVRFLGLPAHTWLEHRTGHLVGEYEQRLSHAVRDRLAAFYRPYNERLYELLGEDFGWE